MSTQEFGQMVNEAMRQQGLSLRRLGARIGVLPDGRVVDATTLKRVVEGQRRSVDALLAWAVIEELNLDPIAASEAAGVWPPGVTADMLRKLDMQLAGAHANVVSPGYVPDHRQRDRRRTPRHLKLVA